MKYEDEHVPVKRRRKLVPANRGRENLCRSVPLAPKTSQNGKTRATAPNASAPSLSLSSSTTPTPPPFTALNVDSSSSSSSVASKKERSRSARQLSWVCLLKCQQLAASLGWLYGGVFHLARTAHRRIVDSASLRGDSSRLYRAIRVFLVVVIVLLGFELVAYFKGWHFRRPDPSDVLGMLVVYAVWVDVLGMGNYFNKGFDLFITTAPIPDLSEKLSVFGLVIKGDDIVQEIEEVDTEERSGKILSTQMKNLYTNEEPQGFHLRMNVRRSVATCQFGDITSYIFGIKIHL